MSLADLCQGFEFLLAGDLECDLGLAALLPGLEDLGVPPPGLLVGGHSGVRTLEQNNKTISSGETV